MYDIVGSEGGDGIVVDGRFERATASEVLFARVRRLPLVATQAAPQLTVDYSAFDRAGGRHQNVAVGAHNVDVVDGCFTNEILGELDIRAGSECVDVGNPDADCLEEPGGADCRLDIGHQSGTAQAHAR